MSKLSNLNYEDLIVDHFFLKKAIRVRSAFSIVSIFLLFLGFIVLAGNYLNYIEDVPVGMEYLIGIMVIRFIIFCGGSVYFFSYIQSKQDLISSFIDMSFEKRLVGE